MGRLGRGARGGRGGGGGAGHGGYDNLGIVALAARRDWDDPGTIRIFARIENASARPIAAGVTLLLDGREMETKPLVIPGAAEGAGVGAGGAGGGEESAGGSTGSMVPGQFPVTFRLETRDAGVAQVRIDRADLLDSDNSAAVVLAPATKPRIVVVVPDAAAAGAGPGGAAGAGQNAAAPAPRPGKAPQWLITSVVQEMGLPLRVVPASAYERDAVSTDPAAHPDLVIFDRVRPRAVPREPSISFGAGLPAPGLDVAAGPAPQGTYVLSWQRTHPLLRAVALDTVYIGHPMPLEPPTATPGAPAVTELARGASGPLMLLGEPGGARHVVVGFALADSTWPLQVGFPIFLASAIDYLTLRGQDQAGRSATTDRPVQLVYSGPRSRVMLQGPETIAADVPGVGAAGADPVGPRVVNFGLIERAGMYRLAEPGDAPLTESVVAVNLLDATESGLEVRETLRVGGEAMGAAGAGAGRLGPREIWPWLVLAALVLLSVEWAINAWLMRA